MKTLELLMLQGIDISHLGGFIPTRFKVVKLRQQWDQLVKVPVSL
jgi:hypothetical protein